MPNQALTHHYLSDNTEAIVNTYVQGYLEHVEEDVTKKEKVINSICKKLQSVEENLYRKEGIHPDIFNPNSILGVEKEYFRKVKLIEDVMKSEVHTIFKASAPE